MTLTRLLIYIAIAAIVITAAVGFGYKKHKSWLMTFLQNYCGVLFIVSGWVKAVDPLGTAYKMEQYFAEFPGLFDGTWFGFISPMFPWLSKYAIGFSVFMIVLEIVLGLLLILGARSKLTSWLFLGIVGFFTFLTGYTYLTGYVPPDVGFWEFGSWAAHDDNNMKVKDCGCFGDFIKLVPKTSFFKDIALLVPAFFFIFRHKDMHQLFSKPVRTSLAIATAVGVFIYCLSNFVWDLPHSDFRDFKAGTDVRSKKAAEEEALGSVQILEWVLTNRETEEVVRISNADYMSQKAWEKYPKAQWSTDQVMGEPSVKQTKISDFAIESFDGDEVTEEILGEPSKTLMVVIPKLKAKEALKTVTVKDTSYIIDTVSLLNDKLQAVLPKIDKITSSEQEVVDFIYSEKMTEAFAKRMNPITELAEELGYKVIGVAGAAGGDAIADLKRDMDVHYPWYAADDILLKTMIRSTPGLILWKDGKVVAKWHQNKLPSAEEFKEKYLNTTN